MALSIGLGTSESIYDIQELEKQKELRNEELKTIISNNEKICKCIDDELNYLKSIGEVENDEPIDIINHKLSLARLNATKIDIDDNISKLEAELCKLYKLRKQYEEVLRNV